VDDGRPTNTGPRWRGSNAPTVSGLPSSPFLSPPPSSQRRCTRGPPAICSSSSTPIVRPPRGGLSRRPAAPAPFADSRVAGRAAAVRHRPALSHLRASPTGTVGEQEAGTSAQIVARSYSACGTPTTAGHFLSPTSVSTSSSLRPHSPTLLLICRFPLSSAGVNSLSTLPLPLSSTASPDHLFLSFLRPRFSFSPSRARIYAATTPYIYTRDGYTPRA